MKNKAIDSITDKAKDQLLKELITLKKCTLDSIQNQTATAKKSLIRLIKKNIVDFFILFGVITGLIGGSLISPLFIIIGCTVGIAIGFVAGKLIYGLLSLSRTLFIPKRHLFSQEAEFTIKDFIDYLNEDTIRTENVITKHYLKTNQICIDFYAKIPKIDLETHPHLHHNKTCLIALKQVSRKNITDEEKIEYLTNIKLSIVEADPIIKQLLNTECVFQQIDSL